jgi:benzoyl-CoA reductase/2-hydroxyglutaryl-CoA dehydratase subunit BcrC/BadD/HgdB
MQRMKKWLEGLSGKIISMEKIEKSIVRYEKLAQLFTKVRKLQHNGLLEGGAKELQRLYQEASTKETGVMLDKLKKLIADVDGKASSVNKGVPVYLFGNVLADPNAFKLFESCGAHIVGDDFCTGSRLFHPYEDSYTGEDELTWVAKNLFTRPPCARTFDPKNPLQISDLVLNNAKAAGALGVIGHTLKFCDPYLARLPLVRESMREAEMPFLLLEGDCTLGSIEQQRTRIEAFVEMLMV